MTLRPVLLVLLAAIAPLRAEEPSSKPNVLVVLLDDLGYSDLGCYGGEIPTPNIDALAKGGLRFTRMANSARCCPTRASLLTGLHPAQAGIPDFSGQLARNTTTLAEVLRDAGYGTYGVGKWHVGNQPVANPVTRGFEEFYGYTNGHSTDQWKPGNYRRLPEGREPELKFSPGNFYATDAFTDYALEFIKQGAAKKKPWFLYLAHSSPHFPVQAPAESAKGFLETYRKGWDVLREQRFERLKKIGLADHDGWKLSPRSVVPTGRPSPFTGQQVPAWDSLEKTRREELAQRMALYAAMVKHVDDGIGRIVRHLNDTAALDNTAILLLSDNGACYEWTAYGFTGEGKDVSKLPADPVRALEQLGGPGRPHISYGTGWANLGNTPFRLYKHFTHEGGILTPFIVHWPAGVKQPDRWVRDPAHVLDLMPTLVEIAGARYPQTRAGLPVPKVEGVSLAPLFTSTDALPGRAICFQHEGACAIRKGEWKLVLGKRFPAEAKWELYDLKADPCELNDLASVQPERAAALKQEWLAWAERTGTPVPGNKPAAGKPKRKAAAR